VARTADPMADRLAPHQPGRLEGVELLEDPGPTHSEGRGEGLG
jgi:hypothetical protein